jgi:hypothetical protein
MRVLDSCINIMLTEVGFQGFMQHKIKGKLKSDLHEASSLPGTPLFSMINFE